MNLFDQNSASAISGNLANYAFRVYAVIHVEYVFIAHIPIYILHKYWMRNSISPFYDVCNCF